MVEEHDKETVISDDFAEETEPEVIEVIDAEKKEAEQVDLVEENQTDLEKEMENIKQEKQVIYEKMLRLQAEFDNFKKRSQKEKQAERKYKSQDLATELLPAMDNFERALQVESTEETASIIDGITMINKQLQEALKSQGIEEIETVNKRFDPNLHHAIMQIEDEELESNIIVEELQKGYILEDRVIRPSMVKVNK